MTWVEKGQVTAFDKGSPLTGLFYLDGDIVARLSRRDWTVGQKMPMLAFPSGEEFPLWESADPAAGGVVHLFGELDLPFKDTRERAFERVAYVAEQVGYRVQRVGENGLAVWGHGADERVLITYDPESGQMQDVVPLDDAEPASLASGLQLMTDELREKLPALYAHEDMGLEALAQVKYFTPDTGWTWYASEFDGEDIFFGLVIGFEIELGYFSLSELRQARGPLGLGVERDLYFKPQTLRELRAYHRKLRGE